MVSFIYGSLVCVLEVFGFCKDFRGCIVDVVKGLILFSLLIFFFEFFSYRLGERLGDKLEEGRGYGLGWFWSEWY